MATDVKVVVKDTLVTEGTVTAAANMSFAGLPAPFFALLTTDTSWEGRASLEEHAFFRLRIEGELGPYVGRFVAVMGGRPVAFADSRPVLARAMFEKYGEETAFFIGFVEDADHEEPVSLQATPFRVP